MTKSYIEYLINNMTYKERSRLVIKIAKMRKFGIFRFMVSRALFCTTDTSPTLYLTINNATSLAEFYSVKDLNLHYDQNVMKLEDIGYMLQKNNRRHLWT